MSNNSMEIDAGHDLPVPAEHVELFFDYLEHRESDFAAATDMLRSEEEALAYCRGIGAEVRKVRTQSQDHHHQSSAAMVAAVSYIAGGYCLAHGSTFNKAPDRRCVWLVNNQLHVTA